MVGFAVLEKIIYDRGTFLSRGKDETKERRKLEKMIPGLDQAVWQGRLRQLWGQGVAVFLKGKGLQPRARL